MHNTDVRAACLLFLAVPVSAQPLRVYSEFAHIDPSGEVTSPANPREILSPAIARNAFTSFQIVVAAEKGTAYRLYIGQNPEDAVRVTLYRETGDGLDRVDLPYEGNGTQVFWMDLWTAGAAPVRRIKVEPQLNINDDWALYPMEGRVVDATVPNGHWQEGNAAPIAVMKSFVCATKLDSQRGEAVSVPGLRFRNAQQDLALALRAPRDALRRLIGSCEAAAPTDPEWYLRVRDYLLRMR